MLDRQNQSGYQRRIHLAVGIDLDDNPGVTLDRRLHPRQKGAADPLICFVHDNDDARVLALILNQTPRELRAAVIDDHDQTDLRTNPVDDIQDGLRGPEGRNNNRIHLPVPREKSAEALGYQS